MPHTFRIRRGLEKDIPRLAPGEPALTTDTRKFYIGTADGNLLINPVISPLENEIEHMNPIVASLIFGRKE